MDSSRPSDHIEQEREFPFRTVASGAADATDRNGNNRDGNDGNDGNDGDDDAVGRPSGSSTLIAATIPNRTPGSDPRKQECSGRGGQHCARRRSRSVTPVLRGRVKRLIARG